MKPIIMDYNRTTRFGGNFPSINDTGKVSIWPMSYHKNRVRRSSAFASGRYSSLVPAVLEKQEQKTLDARDEKERRKRKKQRAAERAHVDTLMKQIQFLQEEDATPVQMHRVYEREDTPEQDSELQDRLSSILGNRDEKEIQNMLKYVVDELDKLKVSLEEVRDIVIMKTSRRHMEWAFHSSRFASSIHGTWEPEGGVTEGKLPKSVYSERMLQSSTFHHLYEHFPTTSSEKANNVEINDDELSHSSTAIYPD